jgi:hypothetical protein
MWWIVFLVSLRMAYAVVDLEQQRELLYVEEVRRRLQQPSNAGTFQQTSALCNDRQVRYLYTLSCQLKEQSPVVFGFCVLACSVKSNMSGLHWCGFMYRPVSC